MPRTSSPRNGQRRLFVRLAGAAALCLILALGAFLRVDVTRHLAPELRPHVQDDTGTLFPYTKDSFLYTRHSRNVLRHGHPGEHLEDGEPFDELSFAPAGRAASVSFLSYLQAWVHRLLPGSSLEGVSFYLPAVFSIFTGLLFFLLGRRLFAAAAYPTDEATGGESQGDRHGKMRGGKEARRAAPQGGEGGGSGDGGSRGRHGGLYCGLLAALLAAVHPELISHCQAGITDTAYLNLFFFALVAWLYLSLVGRLVTAGSGGIRDPATLGIAAALLAALALFRWTWFGASAAILLVAAHAALVALSRFSKRSGRARALAAGALVAGAAVGAFLLLRSTLWARLRTYSQSEDTSFFPQGMQQIQELLGLDPGTAIAWLGGPALLLLAAAGIALGVLRKQYRGWDLVYLLLWLVPTVTAGLLSMRFLVYAVPATILLAAFGAIALSRLLPRPSLRRLLPAAAAALLVWSFAERIEGFRGRRPGTDRAVLETARAVKARSAPDALINVWWDDGYIYSAFAERGVTLDGASFQSRRLYWFSHALTTDDPDRALNLLRLIDCGQEEAVFKRLRTLTDGVRAVSLMKGAASQESPAQIRSFLANAGLPGGEVRWLVEQFTCTPAQGWLIISSDLLGKTTSWVHAGRWRFPGPQAPIRGWISAEIPCQAKPGLLTCANGYQADLRQAGWTDRSTPGYLAAQGPARADGWVPVVYQVERQVALAFVDRQIIDSLFVELYFFRGRNLPRFRLAHQAMYPPYTRRVLAFQLEW